MKAIKNTRAALLLATVLCAAPSFAAAAEALLKGMIVSRDESSILVKTDAGETRVTFTGDTKIRSTTGALGVRGENKPSSALIRGLAVDVKGEQVGSDIAASEIIFKSGDLKTAKQIEAGIAMTEEGVRRNSERLDNVGNLEAAGRTSVYFAVGSSTLTQASKDELQKIAAEAKKIKVYRLAVVGRADPTGNAAANQRLSERRAAAVVSYLLKSCGVSPAYVLPSASLGDSQIAQDPNPPKNDAEARRVTVTIAVSKSAR